MDLMGRINSAGHLSRDQHGSTVSWWVTTPTNLPKQWRNGWVGWSDDAGFCCPWWESIETKHYSMGLGTSFVLSVAQMMGVAPWVFPQSWRKNPVGIPEYPSYKFFQVGAVWTFDVGNFCNDNLPRWGSRKARLAEHRWWTFPTFSRYMVCKPILYIHGGCNQLISRWCSTIIWWFFLIPYFHLSWVFWNNKRRTRSLDRKNFVEHGEPVKPDKLRNQHKIVLWIYPWVNRTFHLDHALTLVQGSNIWSIISPKCLGRHDKFLWSQSGLILSQTRDAKRSRASDLRVSWSDPFSRNSQTKEDLSPWNSSSNL